MPIISSRLALALSSRCCGAAVAAALRVPQFLSTSAASAASPAASGGTAQQAPPVRITDECARRLSELHRDQGRHLRVAVEGGGCSGFQYKFQLDELPKAEGGVDCVIDGPGGVKLVIDTDSLELLRGCTLDYQRELIREGFKVTANPQAEKGCSCGVSFAVRMD